MHNIPLRELFAKMPLSKFERTLHDFLVPVTALLPDKRLWRVVSAARRGVLTQETPVIVARHKAHLARRKVLGRKQSEFIGSYGTSTSTIIIFSKACIIVRVAPCRGSPGLFGNRP